MLFGILNRHMFFNEHNIFHKSIEFLRKFKSEIRNKDPTMAWIPYLLTVVISSCIMEVQARTSGPPEGVCDSMFPAGHNTEAQFSDPPFEIIVDDSEVQPGQTLTGIYKYGLLLLNCIMFYSMFE